MKPVIKRREFLQIAAAGSAVCLNASGFLSFAGAAAPVSSLVSPGCRGTKVKVARLFIGNPSGLWPKPDLDFESEMQVYRNEFAKLKTDISDVDFFVDRLLSTTEEVQAVKELLKKADGLLVIHLTLGVRAVLNEILSVGLPTMVFSAPYSGHEWAGLGHLRQEALGAHMECLLTSDYSQLAEALRPFRAIHHLREAKILNLTTRPFDDYAQPVKNKFGTEIKQIDLPRVLDLYQSVPEREAQQETRRWISEAEKVVEPSEEEIFKSCKLALAFEKLLDEEQATLLTVDCYGSMWDKTIKLPAYPCIGFTRLNNMGYGGICESDLRSAMTHIIFQGLSGRPGFISDPTVDEADNSIILAHCLGTTRMDGPDKEAAPYKLRTVMERQEGVVTQVEMRRGQKVTQAILVGTDRLPYFTGEIIDAPVSLHDDRGCRTKITVKVDGDVTRLWHNWSAGLHRQTCYGDISREMAWFCRFKDIEMVNEAA